MGKVSLTSSVFKIDGNDYPNIDYTIMRDFIGLDSGSGSIWIVYRDEGNVDSIVYSTETTSAADTASVVSLTASRIQGGPFKEIKSNTSLVLSKGLDMTVSEDPNGKAIITVNNDDNTIIVTDDSYSTIVSALDPTEASTLTDGSGTTANGSAVDLGGTMTGDSLIDAGANKFQVTNASQFFVDVNSTGSLQMSGSIIRLTDDRATTLGLQYAADYSADFTARSIPDKAYVDAQSFTLSNGSGTTANGNAVDLGGSLTAASTELDLGSAGNTLSIFGDDGFGGRDEILVGSGGTGLQLRSYSSHPSTHPDLLVDTYSGVFSIISQDRTTGTDDYSLTFSSVGPGSLIFTDNRSTKLGIQYNGDYSADFTARSLVDKAYVDAQSGISNSAANNELMKSDGTDAVSSKLFSSSDGDITLGDTGLAGSFRDITSEGSASNVGINLVPQDYEVRVTTNPSFNTTIPFRVFKTVAGTDAFYNVGSFEIYSSGTPVAGFGASLSLAIEAADGDRLGGDIIHLFSDVSIDNEDSYFKFRSYTGGSQSDLITIDRDGSSNTRVSGANGDLVLTASTNNLTLGESGDSLGFFGTAPSVQQTGYTTFANLTTVRTLDADATSTTEVADVLGTLIEDLKTKGIISA